MVPPGNRSPRPELRRDGRELGERQDRGFLDERGAQTKAAWRPLGRVPERATEKKKLGKRIALCVVCFYPPEVFFF